MASLPPELILEILSRLPVKSLCRFKCVCKSWFSLINDRRFAKLHLNHTQRVKLFISTKFLYNVDLETMTYDDDKVVAVEDDAFPWRSIPIESPSWTPNHYFRQSPKWVNFMGSCHGLVCLEVFRDVWLYNPSTKQYKRIPSFGPSTFSNLYGLGYIESTDDYNVVRIDYCGKYVAIYSLRNDMWTSIEINLPLMCAGLVDSVCLNGAIHWAIDTSMNEAEILVFDLVEKKLNTMPPPEFDKQNHENFSLGLLGGCLCFSTGRGRYHDELWVMKEYGVRESWSRIMRIPPGCYQMKPLCYLNGTDTMVLFMDLYRLVFCNAKDENLKNIEVAGFSDDVDEDDDAEWIDFDLYVESLVSPSLETNVQSEGLEYWFK